VVVWHSQTLYPTARVGSGSGDMVVLILFWRNAEELDARRGGAAEITAAFAVNNLGWVGRS